VPVDTYGAAFSPARSSHGKILAFDRRGLRFLVFTSRWLTHHFAAARIQVQQAES
jgi:hypothetical protein